MVVIRKVLLVEDEQDIRKVAQISLQFRGGWSVVAAGDGIEGLALAASEMPDVVLLDCMMPRMDGYEMCRQLKLDPALRHIPVIFLTAKSQEVEIRKGLQLGAAGYLVKPFNPMSLADEIVKILEDHQAASSSWQ